MKWSVVLLFVGAAVAVADEVVLAKDCDVELCKLPDCRCSSTNIPGDLLPRDTPQFVTVTFDDGVNNLNIMTYREVLYNRKNSNGCPAGATFYVSHEYTNYQFVNELYNQGYEIALHSISHQTPQTYWATASYNSLKEEFADQRVLTSHFANIPMDAIKGVRLPFLQMSGDTSFQVMSDFGLVYDCSWITNNYSDPALWPYTLEYKSTQDCVVPPCPTASIPKTWVMPMVSWTDLNHTKCAMADTCYYTPELDDEAGWFQFILSNFERHYFSNRAPFGFYIHEWYLSTNPAVKAAMIRFLDVINNLSDVFMVNSAEVIDWVKDPVPVDQYREKTCKSWISSVCPPSSCGNVPATHNQNTYWMQICNVCPKVYPWLGNPLGLEPVTEAPEAL